MKILLRLEELGVFLFSIYLFSRLPYAWWVYPVFFFAPDLSMVGYLGGPRVGAAVYNFIHHRALALGLYVLGELGSLPILALIGVLLLGHASLDRVLGYGLKLPDDFTSTHLGPIGRKAGV
jgi:hypothetical protein